MSEDNKTQLAGVAEPPPSKPPSPLQVTPGTVLKGTYRIEAELGSGGMGTVYRATHIGLDKTMAVKVLSPRAVSTPDSLARFEREAKVAGKVSHPAMTHVIDFGVEQGTPYIVMEYVAGVELADLIERQGPMPPRRAVAVMRQIVSLLRAAHALGIVHRDLKPSNIKILHDPADDSQLFVKVLDFGIAKVVGDISGQLTSEGMLVGTPAYMAPEQISGKPIDGRTDLYAVGLIFHEMLSGRRAFRGETIARILHAQMNEPPPPLTLQLPDILLKTVQKFYEKRPEDRFQDAAEADRALQACEDVLRPPSANLSAASVLPQAGAEAGGAPLEGASTSGVRTLAFRPQRDQAEPPLVTPGQPTPEVGAGKPTSSVAVSPSLVRERQSEPLEPTFVREPVAASAPEPAPAPVVAPGPAPMGPPLQPVQPRGSSGGGKVVALLGVALVLVLAGLAGVAWAWTSGRLGGVIPFAPSRTPEVAEPTRPEEPRKDDPALAEAGKNEPAAEEPPPTEVVEANTGTKPPEGTEASSPEPTEGANTGSEPTEGTGTTPTEDTGTTPTEAVAGADTPGSESDTQPQGDDPAPPPAELPPPGCYTVKVALEGVRQPDGKWGPWLPESVGERAPIKCSAIPRGKLDKAQGTYSHWPDSPSEKLLFANPLSYEEPKKGAPNTRRLVVKAYTRISKDAP
jgi:serine/threonine protein kinase